MTFPKKSELNSGSSLKDLFQTHPTTYIRAEMGIVLTALGTHKEVLGD
jgi:hypothetical protein